MIWYIMYIMSYAELTKLLLCLAVPAMQSKLHFQMGRLLLRRGELEEALSHATQAHALILPHLDDLATAERKSKVQTLWDLCGDVSEKMGRLEEAREWDRDAWRRTGVLGVSGRRRTVQSLISQGQHKVRASIPCFSWKSIPDILFNT